MECAARNRAAHVQLDVVGLLALQRGVGKQSKFRRVSCSVVVCRWLAVVAGASASAQLQPPSMQPRVGRQPRQLRPPAAAAKQWLAWSKRSKGARLGTNSTALNSSWPSTAKWKENRGQADVSGRRNTAMAGEAALNSSCPPTAGVGKGERQARSDGACRNSQCQRRRHRPLEVQLALHRCAAGVPVLN
jgi:hypothetical protein